MTDFTLIIGNKNYSSWSLRPWLVMRKLRLNFNEIRIPLYSTTSAELLKQHSPSGRVPVLKHGHVIINDSLAICEYINELYPTAHLWPADLTTRAVARSMVAEMHSGFMYLRKNLPMNCRNSIALSSIDENTVSDIDRIKSMWRNCLNKYSNNGSFLFETFSIADAFFAPVVLRFNTYNIPLDDMCKKYASNILAMPEINKWVNSAKNETEVIDKFEK